uniref:CHAT domain-containing protein n=1 Tax=Bursaphelenchus xylophilus TaxID=6326 RepID=A0A1I7RNV6_BURXY
MTKEELIKKWNKTAEDDLLHDDYSDFLSLNRGLQSYIDTNDKLCEPSFRSQVALLNASLLHQFNGCFVFFDTERAKQCLTRFDYLIGLSTTLEKTKSLISFQSYAKSCFYYRLGDYHLATLLRTNAETVDQTHLCIVVTCYAFGLHHLTNGKAVADLKTVAERLNLLELVLLINGNLKYIGGQKVLRDFIKSEDLVSKVMRSAFFNKSQFYPTNNDKSFIISDVADLSEKFSLPSVDCLKLLPEIWNARKYKSFLNRFLWIMYNIQPIHKDDFLDGVGNIQKLPGDLNMGFDMRNFSILDLKLLIFRLSDHFHRSLNNSVLHGKGVHLPSHFYPLLHKQVIRLWNILNNICDGDSKKKIQKTDEIHFTTALEEVRMDVVYISDKIGLVNSTVYLGEKAKKASTPEETNAYITLFDRYWQVAISAVTNQPYSEQPSSFFPVIKSHSPNIIDDDLLEFKVKLIRAEVLLVKGDKLAAEEIVSGIKDEFKENEHVVRVKGIIKHVTVSPNTSASQFNSTILTYDTLDDSFMTAQCNLSVSSASSNGTLEKSSSGFQIIDHPDKKSSETQKRQEFLNKKHERLIGVMDNHLAKVRLELEQIKRYAAALSSMN